MSTRSLSKLFSFAQKQKVPAKPIKVQLALGTGHLALLFFSAANGFQCSACTPCNRDKSFPLLLYQLPSASALFLPHRSTGSKHLLAIYPFFQK
jgi:hypothetical protein